MAEGAHEARRRGRGRIAPALPMAPPSPPTPSRSPRQMLFGTLTGRLFLAASIVKLVTVVIDRTTGAPTLVSAVGTLAGLIIVITALVFVVRALLAARRQLLWRVRRKLIVSYVFIGLVPSLLLLVFFLFGGQVVFTNVAAYLFKSGYESYITNAQQIAQATANDVSHDPRRAVEILESKVRNLGGAYPGLSVAIVPMGPSPSLPASHAGPWRHLDPPTAAPPPHAFDREFSNAIVCRTAEGIDKLIVRAVRVPQEGPRHFAAIVDVPLGQQLVDRLKEQTAIMAVGVAAHPISDGDLTIPPPPCKSTVEDGLVGAPAAAMPFRYDRSIAFLDYNDWRSGVKAQVAIGLRVRLRELFVEVSEGQQFRLPGTDVSFASALFGFLVLIGALFLIIEFAALVMGLALARSITTAVHELFVGTERVRQGDFTHRIEVQTRDQLGQLADSFNQMSTSIEHLLEQAAEKRRLEEELRIAREIQMSLLPSGPLDMPGIRMTALCVPAREVGGDYYDYFRLGDRRFSLLIADVAGKGTSAALYMAELKGLLLSLSQIHHSPRQLLIEVNRIISDHLDTRSFITMTYAIIDLDARTLIFARAGHTPLVYLPAAAMPSGPAGRAQVLVPDGMVLGLRVPNIDRLFPHHLTEQTIDLRPGDVLALYTDGITEAMNAAGDLFGEARLSHIIEQHAHLEVAELRERILRDVEAFAGAEDQHDDLTMILLKVEEDDAHLPAVHTEGVVQV